MNVDPDQIEKWNEEIELLKRRIRTIQPENENLIAFYGSSSIRLWTTIFDDLSPHNVVNLGFGGSSYYWCNHFHAEVFADLLPSRVILYAGDNDLGSLTPEDDIMRNLSSLIEKIKRHHEATEISIISVKPSPERHYLRNNIESLNERIANLIAKSEGDFINIYSKMLTPEGNYRPELFLEDQLHMNESGYEIWKAEIRSYLDELSQ